MKTETFTSIYSECLDKYRDELQIIDQENCYNSKLSCEQIEFCFECLKTERNRYFEHSISFIDWASQLMEKLQAAYRYRKYGEL